MTYKQLDQILSELGFTKEHIEPKWLLYTHEDSNTEIALIDKQPTESVRSTDEWSFREHVIRKGLIEEEELDALLADEHHSGSKRK